METYMIVSAGSGPSTPLLACVQLHGTQSSPRKTSPVTLYRSTCCGPSYAQSTTLTNNKFDERYFRGLVEGGWWTQDCVLLVDESCFTKSGQDEIVTKITAIILEEFWFVTSKREVLLL